MRRRVYFGVSLATILAFCGCSAGADTEDAPGTDGGGSPAQDASADTPAPPDASVDGDAGRRGDADASADADGSLGDGADGDAADTSHDASGDASDGATWNPDAAVEGGVVPAHCLNLSGEYLMNTDHFLLTASGCASLTWRKTTSVWDPLGWTHVYTTDGVARDVTDEQGAHIREEAHVDDTTMYVHRTGNGSDRRQRVYWSTHPCSLLNPSGAYLTRETFDSGGARVACEYWSYLDACPHGTAECDGDSRARCETSTATDPRNCGGCARICGDANTSAVACNAGRCALTCGAGFGDCDGSDTTGCETDTRASMQHCGGCYVRCSAAGTSAAACSQGVCSITCDASHDDCDHDTQTGCETSLSDDGLSCGACGNDCGGGACIGAQCATHGTALVSGLTSTSELGVDDARLYYVDTTQTARFVDKDHGGAPVVVADHVERLVVAGDGSVYMVRSGGGPWTIERWTAATATSVTLATLSAWSFDLTADGHGAAWSDTQGSPPQQTSNVYTWSPGDATPRVVVSADPGFTRVGALNATHVLMWRGTTLYRSPRAGGPRDQVTPGLSTGVDGTLADDAYAYLLYPGYIDRVPVTGGAPTRWVTAGYRVSTDGLSFFGQDAFEHAAGRLVEIPKADPTHVRTVGYASGDARVVADARALYVFERGKGEIRRVPR